MRAVVLHSGGLDSTTLISQAISDGAEGILAVSVKYGSLHNEAEGRAAAEVVEWFRDAYEEIPFRRETFELPSEVFRSERSALMGEIEMPNISYQDIRESTGPSPTVVPFRNANLLSIATALADARDYDRVYIGAHGDDAHEFAYPDCTPMFLGAMANAIYVGTYHKVQLVFPFIWMTKGEIVARAAQLEVPLELTWSCYNPKAIAVMDNGNIPDYIHCGTCPTCIERAWAFAEAGFLDPTNYAVAIEDIIKGANIDDLEDW
jgi:7-cyano-7-deazaguanine synthase